MTEAKPMDLGITKHLQPILEAVRDMVRNEIMPLDEEFLAEVGAKGDRWSYTPRQTEILEGLKAKAKERGLWNLWRTQSGPRADDGRICLSRRGNGQGPSRRRDLQLLGARHRQHGGVRPLWHAEHKKQWLEPLLNGEIRSAYLMTEPDVASSDATNVSMACVRDGDDYVLNGEKWWASGVGDPRCKIYIVMVRTGGDDTPKHARHSMILVPADTAGIEKLRPMQVYGQDDAPHGHFHLRFTDVRVPASNLLVGEGKGFEIAQGRLGPGRIHHCMRAIGQAEMALELMCKRSLEREAFGKKLAQLGANYDIIAECRMEIEHGAAAVPEGRLDDGSGRRPSLPPPGSARSRWWRRAWRSRSPTRRCRCSAARAFPRTRLWPACWTHLRTLQARRWSRRRAPPPGGAHRTQTLHAGKGVICHEGDRLSRIRSALQSGVQGPRRSGSRPR
jgi:acyl-CoA dehydrogenase